MMITSAIFARATSSRCDSMGKLLLISGTNGSGKSRYAESFIAKTTGLRYYVATMEPQTQENQRRIRKHIAQRSGLNFITLEQPTQVGTAPVAADSVVLLEDVSNLLGNTLFSARSTMEDAWQDILALRKRCKLLVAVTISGLSSGGYDGETAAYIENLNILNRRLLDLADAAVTMKNNCPVWEKGAEHDILEIPSGGPVHL